MAESDTDSSTQRGLLRLLWGIIVRPRATQSYVGERGRRTWWLPALLVVLLIVLPVLVSGPLRTQQAREELRTAQEEMAEQLGEDVSEEQLERAMSMAASPLLTVVFPAVGGAVSRVVGWLVWAGALYLVGMVFGGRSTFGQMFSVVVWAWFPYALRGVLQTVYVLVSGQLIVNPGLSGLVQNEPSVSETVLASPSVGQTLFTTLLSRIDLFLVWTLMLLVIGVRMTTQLSRRKAVLVTLGVWVVLTGLSLLPAWIGGLFAAQLGM
ncbi:MAG: Yip1 family protein [Anaerolineae bacterium]